MGPFFALDPISGAARQTMKAVRVSAFGGREQMTLADVAIPLPGRGQVLVRIAAAGVGPWDGWILAGKSALPQPLPLTLGADFAGEVVALGEEVSHLSIGERVYGVVNPSFTGAWAEYAAAEAGMMARAPACLSSIDAASAPIVAVTAGQALFDEAKLVAGQDVLVLGATGNVGVYAVQMARDAGLNVVATASARESEYLTGLGAHRIVDARALGFEAEAPKVDVVIDLFGGETRERAFALLKPGGKLISTVSPPDAGLAATKGVEARFFLVAVTTEKLEALTLQFERGSLAPRIGAVLPLSDARAALALVQGDLPRQRGKVVLSVA